MAHTNEGGMHFVHYVREPVSREFDYDNAIGRRIKSGHESECKGIDANHFLWESPQRQAIPKKQSHKKKKCSLKKMIITISTRNLLSKSVSP